MQAYAQLVGLGVLVELEIDRQATIVHQLAAHPLVEDTLKRVQLASKLD